MWKGFKVIDADAHMHEPQYLWERYVEPKYRDRVPKVAFMDGNLMVYEPDGKFVTKSESNRRTSKARTGNWKKNTARPTGNGGRRKFACETWTNMAGTFRCSCRRQQRQLRLSRRAKRSSSLAPPCAAHTITGAMTIAVRIPSD